MAKDSAKILIAVAAGVVAGIGIGLLIAPSRGAKTRKRLKKRFMEFADMVQDELSEKISAIKSEFESAVINDDKLEPEAAPEQEVK
jgi:gas vesicle protein